MKIILKDDIKDIGECGEVIEVKGGYARNYLIPQNLAIMATTGNLKSIEEIKKQKGFRDSKKKKGAEKIKDKLEKISITADVNVGEGDKVFGSVTVSTISSLLKVQGFEIDKRLIILDEPIKALGVYTIQVKLEKDVIANVKLWVVKKEN
ncbi:MAG: 50S ribosomal protein L9 [candidate division Zixibacteria bacterium]|nr:50S ribosomal protein L9 [candidate division Zixibacteria bacterium]